MQKLLHHLIMGGRITRVSAATTLPFEQCIVRHTSKSRERNNSHQPGTMVQQQQDSDSQHPLSFRDCAGTECASQIDAQRAMSEAMRLSERPRTFTARARESMCNGSWVASLRTPSTKRRRRSAMRSRKSSNVCNSEDIEA
jgi:hypothetical protein